MAIKEIQSTAQANPKTTLGLGTAAGYLFLGGLKGALLGGGAGALLLGIAGVKKAFSFAGEGEDPRYSNVYDWRAQFGQDDDSDASYLDSDQGDGGDQVPEGLDTSTWVQDDTTSEGDTTDQDGDVYEPGAGGMVGQGDQFTSGPELISESAEDEEGTGVWSDDDNPESEYDEGEDQDDGGDYQTDGGGDYQTDGGGGGYGGGGSSGGGGGGGSYDNPPPNVPTQGAAGGGPSTVSSGGLPAPPDGGLPAAIAANIGPTAVPVACNPQSAADVMRCLTQGLIDGATASQLLAQFGRQAQAAATAQQQQAAAAQQAAGGSKGGTTSGLHLNPTAPPRPTTQPFRRTSTPGTVGARAAAGVTAMAPRQRSGIQAPPPAPHPVGAPTTGMRRAPVPRPPPIVAPTFHRSLGTSGVAGRR